MSEAAQDRQAKALESCARALVEIARILKTSNENFVAFVKLMEEASGPEVDENQLPLDEGSEEKILADGYKEDM